MWKSLHNSKPPLYLTFHEEDNGFEIYITDYIHLWCVNFTKESFHSRLQECNNCLEYECENELIQQGISMLSQPDKIKKLNVEKEDGDKVLSVCMLTSFGYPFKFECKLTKSSEQFFYEKVTKHLLKIISDLHSSQAKLRETLKKKDTVIKAFKSKGGTLSTRNLKISAVEFNDEAHMNGHKEYEKVFGENAKLETFPSQQELSSGDQNRSSSGTIKVEPGSIKTEQQPTNIEAVGTSSLISASIKQEDVKVEPLSSNIAAKKQRKKYKI